MGHTAITRLSAVKVPALDGIRGIAVLLVLLHHLSNYLPHQSRAFSAAAAVLRTGWVGVDLFFVLSGFLITGILLDTKYAPNYFQSFYARRVLRIFPLYYTVLSAVLLAALLPYAGRWLRPILPLPHDRWFYFVYLNNWWPLLKDTWHANIIGHFWSLAVEEQFYLLWPLCVWLLPRKKLPWVAGFGIVTALIIRCVLYFYFSPTRSIVENTFSRMDTLLMGASMAMLVRSPGALKTMRPYLYAAALTSLCLLVGKYSYGMYVYHVPIMLASAALLHHFVTDRFSAMGSVAFMAGIILATYAVAKLSFELFESRFLKQKKRFSPREPIQLRSAEAIRN